MTSALQNIKVVDLTRTLAGPFCTMPTKSVPGFLRLRRLSPI